MVRVCFDGIDDDRVLDGIQQVVRRSNEITAELLAYLMAVERRRLHLREACSSLFAFCVERLHLSESAAGNRITAMRTAQRFPLAFELIARGDIHLTALNMLAAHLTEENHVEVLARARHRSKREIEALVAEVAPRPDLPSRVAAVPQRTAPVVGTPVPPAGASGGGTRGTRAGACSATGRGHAALAAPLCDPRDGRRRDAPEAAAAAGPAGARRAARAGGHRGAGHRSPAREDAGEEGGHRRKAARAEAGREAHARRSGGGPAHRVDAGRRALCVRGRQGAPVLGDRVSRVPPRQQLGARSEARRLRDRAPL